VPRNTLKLYVEIKLQDWTERCRLKSSASCNMYSGMKPPLHIWNLEIGRAKMKAEIRLGIYTDKSTGVEEGGLWNG
jgi:hypothetical protein